MIGVDRGRLGGVLCRCAVGIGGEHVVWVVCSVAVPWGLVWGASRWVCLAALCRRDWWGACRFGRVWCFCGVGLGGGRVVLGVSGVIAPWGLVGGVSCLVVLEFAVSCQVVSCRIMSCRVVSRRVASSLVVDKSR